MRAKALEIRDRATFIPVLAVDMNPDFSAKGYNGQRYLLRRAGFACDGHPIIVFTYMHAKGHAYYDPYDWPSNPRTMRVAHNYVAEHWEELEDGDVVDVEFILKETTEPKKSEKYDVEA
jgi:hypothetical protein